MGHSNTVMAELVKIIPRHEFEKLAREHHRGRSFRKSSRWSQCVSLLMGQLGGRESLRDVLSYTQSQRHRLYHLGVKELSRSNLARMNQDKPYELYEALFGRLLNRVQAKSSGHGFKFNNPLYSLDATTIDLCLSLFDWAQFRQTKGAIKLHVGLNHRGYLPEFMSISNGKTHDVTAGRELNFPAGSIVAMDKGYNDYAWYKQLSDKGIFFVTRLKSNAKYRVLERKEVTGKKGITSDQKIQWTGAQAARKCPIPLRRIEYRDPDAGKHYTFLTNNFKLSSATIAAIYKARWQIELFFKWIKQNLKIKSFLGHSKNAVMTQIWIAMCAYLLLAWLKFTHGITRSMQQILRLLQNNLFEKRDLIALLNGQPDPPPPDAHPELNLVSSS